MHDALCAGRPRLFLLPGLFLRLTQIKTKKAKNGKELSMGFGFVELASLTEAKAAVKALQVGLGCSTETRGTQSVLLYLQRTEGADPGPGP